METRIQKYRKYRAQMVKEDALTEKKEIELTTTSLSMDEVMNKISEDEQKESSFNKERVVKSLKYGLMILALIPLVGGLIVLGIFTFRR